MERLYCDENMKTRDQFRAHHLYKFLYRHGLFDKFIRNTLNSPFSSRRVAANDFLDKKISFITFLERVFNIDLAFVWDRTLEGQKFWQNLHNEENNQFNYWWLEYEKMAKKH